ncbi:hypothetical protein SPF06_07120 [Sinomonas sp. JGH33]|uniref:Helix-turn-helix domain containing protein n=1 Tax=Sinomonas terricola TaxID=3110330 RepID=A0ABU5T491_9MICC|nr:hypothetical protein [Sinomonas sp. JGH33]MEA5454488.1 hypothetical protein [Sinomonas sp. JGH33]
MSTRVSITCEECGHTTTSKSRATAEYGQSLHRCATALERKARAERVAERRIREGVKRECQCKRARHEHGTRTMYVRDKCRCRPCTDANLAAERARARAKLYGRYDCGRVPAAPVREHVQGLMAAGIGIKRVSALSGVSTGTLSKLLYGVPSKGIGPRERCQRDVADRLLAVALGTAALADGALVDATGTHRRLQALVSIGYSVSRLGEMLGIDRANMAGPIGRHPQVTAATARKAAALYERLWNVPHEPEGHFERISASRARNHAAARGWAPPMAWDDDTIDDPAASPTGTEQTMRTSAHTSELVEDIEHMLTTGASPEEVAHRTGRNPRDLDRILYRAGRRDLATWLRTGEQPATYQRQDAA